MRDGIDQRIEIESGKIGILSLDENHVGRVVPERFRKGRDMRRTDSK